jgi:hypothetical protein
MRKKASQGIEQRAVQCANAGAEKRHRPRLKSTKIKSTNCSEILSNLIRFERITA